jgi:hypothetical protein
VTTRSKLENLTQLTASVWDRLGEIKDSIDSARREVEVVGEAAGER